MTHYRDNISRYNVIFQVVNIDYNETSKWIAVLEEIWIHVLMKSFWNAKIVKLLN